MNGFLIRRRNSLLVAFLLCATFVFGQQPPANNGLDTTLTTEQIKTFLRTAKVIGSKQSKKGITNPYVLTLTDGTTTHNAGFEVVDEHKDVMRFSDGKVEMNFTDCYKYNIAAYELAEMLGIQDLLPVYVERRWSGMTGSLSWWLPVKMDAADRMAKKIEIPDSATDTWNNQMYKIRVFDQLVEDTDPNLTNVLIGENWKIWRIDFSRAFRLDKEPKDYKNLTHCDRQLLEKLRTLDANEFAQRTKPYLSKDQVKAVMQRRDKIVEYLQKQIAEKGESAVLY